MVARNPSCGCQSGTPFNPPSGCCAECVCYPDLDHIVTDCSDVPCLYDNYLIAGELPFGGDSFLTHDSGCDYSSGSFDVTICDTDYGMFHWELTVGTGSLDGSTLTLVADGSNSLPLVYKSTWYFNPLCGNTFALVFDCGLPPDIAHSFPCDLCIVADGDACDPCPVPQISTLCCPSDLIPATIICTLSGCTSASVTLTWNDTYHYFSSGTSPAVSCGPTCGLDIFLSCDGAGHWGIVVDAAGMAAGSCIPCEPHSLSAVVVCNPFHVTGSVDLSGSGCPCCDGVLNFDFAPAP
jgi:hypothetical protein